MDMVTEHTLTFNRYIWELEVRFHKLFIESNKGYGAPNLDFRLVISMSWI